MANHAGAFRRNRRECLFVWGDIVHPHRFLRANFAVEIAYSIGSYRGIFPQSGIANLIVLHEISENLVSTGRRSRGLERLWKRSEEHTSELQSRFDLVCRLLLEKKKKIRQLKPHPPITNQAS